MLSCSIVFDASKPHGLYSPPGSSVHDISQTRILEWVAISFTRRSSQPRDRTLSSCLRRQILYAEPPRKPKNTRVGSLSLFQQTLLTQELNCGLLNCTWVLYQLSYQGSPGIKGLLHARHCSHLVFRVCYI